MTRGTFGFEVGGNGTLMNSASNVETLRKLWLDRSMVDGEDLGPGDEGDFGQGTWHVACHVVAAGGVRRTPDGHLLWLEISHDPDKDEYFGSVTARGNATLRTAPLGTAAADAVLQGSMVVGYVEGNSVGRISASGVNDPPRSFNLWTRQQFDQPPDSDQDGGKV